MAITALKDLSDANAGWGVTSYNGFTFSGLRKFKLAGRDIYDEANRVITDVEYTLTISAVIYATSEANEATAVSNARKALNQPGGTLVITGQGLGDIRVNGSTPTHIDVAWGPRPQSLELNSVGGLATEVVWVCTFRIKECSGTSGATTPIMAWNYDCAYSFDESGLCTRVISGYLQIRQTRATGSTRLTTSADQYRNRIQVAVPAGFGRKTWGFPISKDKSRLDFFFVDMQLDGAPLPEDIIKADLTYGVESIPPGFQKFHATLSGTLEVAPGKPTSRAARMFMTIALDKLTKLRRNVGANKTVIPDRIRMETAVFGRASSFSISFLVISCLDDIIKKGGIWESLSGVTYEKWARSMERVWNVRGTAGLVYNPSQDALVDLCSSNAINPIGNDGGTSTPYESDTGVFGAGQISKENSWLAFENSLEVSRAHSLAHHKVSDGYTPGDAPLNSADFITQDVTSLSAVISVVRRDVSQYQAGPTELVLMRGKAMRIKYKPAIPRLLKVGGFDVEVVKEKIDGPKTVGCFFDTPVYVARWAILYRLKTGYLSSLKARKNPSICCDPGDSE